MSWLINTERRKRIFEHVREVRVREFGRGEHAEREMAEAMKIPYTTYRGYERNRVNVDFLHDFGKRWGSPSVWLLTEEGSTEVAKSIESGKRGAVPEGVVCIHPSRGDLKSKTYKIFSMADNSMAPLIPEGSWFGVLPLAGRNAKEIHGKIIAYRHKNKICGRKVVVSDSKLIGLPTNPDPAFSAIPLKKTNITGEIVWVFKTIS